MSRLSRSTHALREPRATAALLIAILALAVALAGGSYAAGRYLGAAASKSKPQVRRGPRGPRGEVGPAGSPGGEGERGAPGARGADGENLIARTVLPGNVHCQTGGTEFKFPDGTTSFTCNGEQGAQGKEGPAWPPGGTLPPGDVESGTWAAGPSEGGTAQASISFPIPLPSYVTATTVKCEVRTLQGECISRWCSSQPVQGYLCIYGIQESELKSVFNPENNERWEGGTTGAVIFLEPGSPSEGSWAVTAGTEG